MKNAVVRTEIVFDTLVDRMLILLLLARCNSLSPAFGINARHIELGA